MKYITAKEMAAIDSVAMKKFGIKIEEMMELAGKHLANFVYKKFRPKSVVILFGKGNNGGGGLVAARHLVILGVKVKIVGASSKNNVNVRNQLRILGKMGIKPGKFGKADVIIDALLGYNIKGNPRAKYAELIKKANRSKAKIVSLDLPSGLDPDSGERYSPSVSSDYVVTLALPKIGLKKVRNVYLANIGIPKKVYDSLGIKTNNYFSKGDVVRV